MKVGLLRVQESSLTVQQHATNVEQLITMLNGSSANEIGEMLQMIHARAFSVLQHNSQGDRMDFEIHCDDVMQGSTISSPNGSDGASAYSGNSADFRVFDGLDGAVTGRGLD
jgi:hypothetical protein